MTVLMSVPVEYVIDIKRIHSTGYGEYFSSSFFPSIFFSLPQQLSNIALNVYLVLLNNVLMKGLVHLHQLFFEDFFIMILQLMN